MIASIPNSSMNLKKFMVRQQVLSLYRKILRTIKQVPNNKDQEYFKKWAVTEFKNNKTITDELSIKCLIVHGETSMNELQKNLKLAK